MFVLLFVVSVIGSFISFTIMCQDISQWYLFLSCLISMIVFWKLKVLDERSKQNEEEIAKLKQHFGIKDGDRVNSSDDIMSESHEK